jgi:hypothetical protein
LLEMEMFFASHAYATAITIVRLTVAKF